MTTTKERDVESNGDGKEQDGGPLQETHINDSNLLLQVSERQTCQHVTNSNEQNITRM